MAWTFIGAGTRATGGATLTSPLNGSTAIGDFLVCYGREKNVANSVNTPTGYLNLTNTLTYQEFSGKYAGASEPNPSASFSNGYLCCATFRWVGGAAPSIGSIVDAAGAQHSALTQTNIPFPGVTPVTNGCLILAGGFSQGAGSGSSIADPSQYPTNIDEFTNFSSGCGAIWDFVIQTTAAAITSGTWTVTSGTSATVTGIVLPLIAGAGAAPSLMGQASL